MFLWFQLPQLLEGPANSLLEPALDWALPSVEMVRALMYLAWAAATGSLASIHRPNELWQAARDGRLPEAEDVTVSREALHVLTLSLSLHPSALTSLIDEKLWHKFVIDLLLLTRNR